MWRKRFGSVCLLITLTGLATGGCVLSVIPDNGTGDGTTPPTTITIRINNQTGRTLDPQVYVGKPGEAKDTLFTTAANKQSGFGAGKLGIMLPGDEAVLTFKCDQLGFFGTAGGIFGDDLRTPLGIGQQISLQQGENVPCGAIVVFTFTASGSRLITSFGVSPTGG